MTDRKLNSVLQRRGIIGLAVVLISLICLALGLLAFAHSKQGKRFIQSRLADTIEHSELSRAKFWLSLGGNPNVDSPPYSKTTPLDLAVRNNDSDAIKLLLENGADLEIFQHQGILLGTGDLAISKLLIANGAEWKSQVNYLAGHASEEGNPRLLEYYLDLGGEASGKEVNLFGHTLLEAAATSGSVACCKILLDRGAEINGIDQPETVEFIGIGPGKVSTKRRESPLRKALRWDRVGVAMFLIEQGAAFDPRPESNDFKMAGPNCKKLLKSLQDADQSGR